MPKPARKAAQKKAAPTEVDSDADNAAQSAQKKKRAIVIDEDEEDYVPPADAEDDHAEEEDEDEVVSDHMEVDIPSESEIVDGAVNKKKTAKKTQAKQKLPKKPPKTIADKRGTASSLGKGELLTALLGARCDIELAGQYREAWYQEVRGVVQDTITAFRRPETGEPDRVLLPANEQIDNLLTDLTKFTNYLPLPSSTLIEVIKSETKELHDVELPLYGVHDPASLRSEAASFTVYTGLQNRTIAWRPTQESSQCVAVGGLPLSQEDAPMFQFQPGPGCLQIWQVTLESKRSLQLQYIILHDFGTTWQLQWRPFDHTEDCSLLAGVFGDGSIRIMSIPSQSAGAIPEHRYIQQPAYTLGISDSSITCFTWISSSRIAAGCANGMVVIWDLSVDTLNPIISAYVHHCYINNIVSCTPSLPDHILTTSWDCEVKISNIHDLESDFMSPGRERMSSYGASWIDSLQCGLINEDANGARLFSVRHGESTSLAPCKSTVTSLHASPHHPLVAVGEASGQLMIINSTRKLLTKKHPQFRRIVYTITYARSLKKYRVLENFAVDELPPRNTARNENAIIAIHPTQVNVNAVQWCNNEGYEGVLASCVGHFFRVDDVRI